MGIGVGLLLPHTKFNNSQKFQVFISSFLKFRNKENDYV